MSNKIYLKSNSVVTEGNERQYFYTDIGMTSGGHNSYRLWISTYVLKDEIGEYIHFPIRDTIIVQGREPRTLVLKHKLGYNVYDIRINDDSDYRLSSVNTSWKYYDGNNEGLLVVAPTAEVKVYYEDKDFSSNRGNIISNIYGFNEIEAITTKGDEKEAINIATVIKEVLIEAIQGGNYNEKSE